MWLLAMLLSAFCLAVAPLSSSCEAWKRAKKTGDAFQDCVRHRPWCARKSAHCDQKLSRAEFYSCWNTGWPLSQEESREYQFETLASLAASNVSMRVVPFFVAIGGTDVDTKLVGTTGLCFDVDGSMCKSEPTLMPVLGQLSPEVLAATLKSRAAPVDFDILKIDVDSTDCPLLDAVIGAGFRPRVVVIEASPAWPPPLLFRREAADYTPSSMCPRARNKWLLTGCDHIGEFFYGCSLQEVYEALRPHGYLLLQYAMEDAMLIHRDYVRGGADAAAALGLTPAEAYRRGNPHVYFRNNAGNATVSRSLLEAMGMGGTGPRPKARPAALYKAAIALFEAHSGIPAREVPHRAGFYHPIHGRVWVDKRL